MLTSLASVLIVLSIITWVSFPHFGHPDFSSACVPPPRMPLDVSMTEYMLYDPTFRSNSSHRLAKALQIDTCVNDGQEDFAKMQKFHDYFESEFFRVFQAGKTTLINNYAYVIEFQGSDTSLKPLMLMAHQDTVPIGDLSKWKKDPWSGDIDDNNIYGRGASDDKSLLIGLMETMDMLLKEGWKNKRTIIFGFDYDEEIGGKHGAQYISKYVQEKYGPKSIELIVDEGVGSYVEMYGTSMIAIPVAEKGPMNILVEATGISGHSSMPPKHTAIGILTHFLTTYEKDEFPVHLLPENPMVECLECLAKNSPQLTIKEKLAISKMKTNEKAAEIAAKLLEPTYFKWGVKTSRAIDIVSGGNKINALPITAQAMINHRVVWGENATTLLATAASFAEKTAKELGVGLVVGGKEIYPYTALGGLNITLPGEIYEPSFISPSNDTVWKQYTGYLRTLYEDYVFKDQLEGRELAASPATFSGNTDTEWMWNITDNIYRAVPGMMAMGEVGYHAPNEFVPIDKHLECVAFYYSYIKGTC